MHAQELDRLKDLNRKLKILEKYNADSTFTRLDELTAKWTEVCKAALCDLKSHAGEGDVKMNDLLQMFNIDPVKFKFDEVNDCFE